MIDSMKDSVAGSRVFANNLGIRPAQNNVDVGVPKGGAVGANLIFLLDPAISADGSGAASGLRLDSVEHDEFSVASQFVKGQYIVESNHVIHNDEFP